MTTNYVFYADLLKELEIPENGILSRTIHQDDQVKVLVFGFDTGQELSEHTASMPAVLYFLQGEARLTLGEEAMEVSAGAWVHMQPNLAHSIYAKTPVVMLLELIKN